MIEGGSIPTGGELESQPDQEKINKEVLLVLWELVQYNNLHRSIEAGRYYAIDMFRENPGMDDTIHKKIALALDSALEKYFESHEDLTKGDASFYHKLCDERCRKDFTELELNKLKEYKVGVEALYDEFTKTPVEIDGREYRFTDGDLGVVKEESIIAQLYSDLYQVYKSTKKLPSGAAADDTEPQMLM